MRLAMPGVAPCLLPSNGCLRGAGLTDCSIRIHRNYRYQRRLIMRADSPPAGAAVRYADP